MTTRVVYKVLRVVYEDGNRYLTSEMAESKFAMTYSVTKDNRHPWGLPLLAYREPPYYAPMNSPVEVWEAAPLGVAHGIDALIDTFHLEKMSRERLSEIWQGIIVNGSISRKKEDPDFVEMRAPRNTVAVSGLRLIRRLPRTPLPITQLKNDPDRLHRLGQYEEPQLTNQAS